MTHIECRECHFHCTDPGTPYCTCKQGRSEHEEGHQGCPEGITTQDAKYLGHEGV